MSEQDTNVTQESLPEADTKSVDEILNDAANDVADSEVEKTPEVQVQPKAEPKTVPYDRFKEINDENKRLKTSNIAGAGFMDNIKLGKALSDFSETELDEVVIRAKGRFNTLTPTPEQVLKASQDENFRLSIEASRRKLADSKKVPGSSSPDFAQPSKSYQDIAKMSKDDFRKFAQEQERGKSTGI